MKDQLNLSNNNKTFASTTTPKNNNNFLNSAVGASSF